MKKLFLLVFAIFQAWALTCDLPVALSEVDFEETLQLSRYNRDFSERASINDQGHAVLIWNDENQPDSFVIKTAVREAGQWTSSILSESAISADALCEIDPLGKITVGWTGQDDSDWISQKKEGQEWETPIPFSLSQPFDEYIVDNEGRFLYFILEDTYLKVIEKSFNSSEEKEIFFRAKEPPTGWEDPVTWQVEDLVIGASKNGEHFIALWRNTTQDKPTIFKCLENRKGNLLSLEEVAFPKQPSQGVEMMADADDDLEVAINSKGDVCILGEVWDNSQENYEYGYSIKALFAWVRSSEGKWDEPAVISGFEDKIAQTQIAVDEVGNVMVVWCVHNEEKKLATLYAAYKPVGQHWFAPMQITPSHETNCIPFLQVDASGRFLLVWQRVQKRTYLSVYGTTFSASTQQWSQPILLSPLGEDCFLYSVALNSKGNGIIAWVALQPQLRETSLRVANLSLD